MTDSKHPKIRLAQGNGGKLMRELIEQQFTLPFNGLNNPSIICDDDSAILPACNDKLVVTTDSFTVDPLEFPGGNLGKLAVCGAVNDLIVCGATPQYLTLGAILEEGLSIATLSRCVKSFAETAKLAGVSVVSGDTKVVPRGHGGGLYFNVTAIGYLDQGADTLNINSIKPGDQLIMSGTLGQHGAAIMLAREQTGFHADIESDCALLSELQTVLRPYKGIRFMRDPTRGGVASVCHEIMQATGMSIELDESALPISREAASLCELLAIDPLYLTCEGRMLLVCAPDESPRILTQLCSKSLGQNACVVGKVNQIIDSQQTTGKLILTTRLGGSRLVPELTNEPLPRIC